MEEDDIPVVPQVGDILVVEPFQLSGSRIYFVQVDRISPTGQLTCRHKYNETVQTHHSCADHSTQDVPGQDSGMTVVLRPTRGREAHPNYYTTKDPQFGTETCLISRYDPTKRYHNTTYY